MGVTILPQTFTSKFDEMNAQLEIIANAQSTASGGIADAVNLANQATQNANAKITDVENRFNTLTATQQQDSEVIDARKGEVSLKAKIDKIDTAQATHLADYACHLTTGAQTFTGTKTINGVLNGAYAFLRNGAGPNMFCISNSLILLYAVDKTTPANYIVAIGYKGLQLRDTHVLNIIKNNVLTLGASNNQGTQVINGGDYGNILFYGISIPI